MVNLLKNLFVYFKCKVLPNYIISGEKHLRKNVEKILHQKSELNRKWLKKNRSCACLSAPSSQNYLMRLLSRTYRNDYYQEFPLIWVLATKFDWETTSIVITYFDSKSWKSGIY